MFWAKLGLIAALIIGAAWFVRDYTVTKQHNKELSARVEQADDVSGVLGRALQGQRAISIEYREAFQKLNEVQDEGHCDSPAIDWVFDRLRDAASAVGEGAAGSPDAPAPP